MAKFKKGAPILKIQNGQIVRTYDNIKLARETENIGYTRMRAALDHGTIINGCRYEFVNPDKKPKKLPPRVENPWEKNGMFDITGWGQLPVFA